MKEKNYFQVIQRNQEEVFRAEKKEPTNLLDMLKNSESLKEERKDLNYTYLKIGRIN